MANERKVAIILQAGNETHEGLARALHALLYAKELDEHGHHARIIFDGAGTTWFSDLLNDDKHDLHPMFEELRQANVIASVCEFCSSAFEVRDRLEPAKELLAGEYGGHPSLAKLYDEGFEVLVL